VPSRSSSACSLGALLTALGLATGLIGLVQSSKIDQTAGLFLTTAGAIPLLLLVITVRDIQTYRAEQVSAGLQEVEDHRAEIEGHAFGTALELIRSGQLTKTSVEVPDTLVDTGGRRYDL
jgi:hypothetical protein